MLAASFFFSRGAGPRARIAGLIPTLAYQLTLSVPDTKPSIRDVLQGDPTIPDHSLEDQFQKLMLKPMLALSFIRPMIIVIDALDECDDKGAITEFIEILLRASQVPRFPFLFLLTGRAENHIMQKFSSPESQSSVFNVALQEFDAHVDIHTFLEARFSKFSSQNPRLMQGVQQPWPSASEIESLAAKSSGLFIFASTLFDFITDGRGAPQGKLETVLGAHAGLDPLYTQVFSAVGSVKEFHQVISTIMLLREQLSITALGQLLKIRAEDILQAVLAIQSVLKIPENNDMPVELIHASLRDFLIERQRSGIYYIDPPTRHASIVFHCLKIIEEDATKEILARSDAALYACQSWHYHLGATLIEGGMTIWPNSLFNPTSCLLDFKSRSLNYWVNTMIYLWSVQESSNNIGDVILRLKVRPVPLLGDGLLMLLCSSKYAITRKVSVRYSKTSNKYLTYVYTPRTTH
jgi:hypothetical protein